MSYDIHLTRSADWHEEEKPDPITADELVGACVEVGFTLSGDGEEDFQLGRVLPGIGVVDLMSASLSEGQITVKPVPPDRDSGDRLTRLAGVLGARIQGDDGELYEVAPVLAPAAEPKKRRWFRGRR